MGKRFLRACRWFLFGILAIGTGTGCEDALSPDPDTDPHLTILVRETGTGLPVPGIKLALMAEGTNTLAAGPLPSDAAGQAAVKGPGEGPFRLLVFGGATHAPLFIPDAFVIPRDIEIAVELRALPGPVGLPRISGTVVDARSGKPLAGAFVSTSAFLDAYQGDTGADDDLTGEDGSFQVSGIPFTIDPITQNIIQVIPLRVTRGGFEPLVWRYQAPRGDDQLDIRGVVLSLVPVSGEVGRISGRLLRGLEPVAGVQVGIGPLTGGQALKGGAGLVGRVAVSDSEGFFGFQSLPAGRYLLHPGYLPDDGVFFPDQEANRPLAVVPDQTTPAGDYQVLHEISAVRPRQGELIGSPPDSLSWKGVPGVADYRVTLDGDELVLTGAEAAELPDWVFEMPGLHFWNVVALDDQGLPVGVTQDESWFRVDPEIR